MKPFLKIIRKSVKPVIFITVIGCAVYWLKFAPVPVEKYQVKRGEIVNEVMGTGILDAKIKMIISSKISGRIENVIVDQGDKVSADQLVATLDVEPLKLQIELAQATLGTVESAVNKLNKDLEYSKAVLSNAEKNYERFKKLISNNTISQEEFDKADETLKMARAKYSGAEAAVIEAKNKIIEAKKTLELRKSQFDDSQIRAPFGGIITERKRDPGNILIPGSAILSLVSTNVLWIKAWVGETELEKIKKGQPAKIIFRSEPEHVYPGKVARIAIKVDKEPREFIVEVNVNKLPVNWAIGQRAEVYIETEKKKNVVVIPEKYIKWQKNKSGVFVDKGGRALWNPVKTGLHSGNFIEIRKGLKEGDSVLLPLRPKNKLKNNARISLK
jgi:RND family efflux transporter MFP subunit